MPLPNAAEEPEGWPAWHVVLRALREARGTTQAGWAAHVGYSTKTVQRWERGEVVPDAVAEAALVTLVREEGLLRRYSSGALRGHTLSEGSLRQLLADARGEKHSRHQPSVLQLVATPAVVPPPTNLPTPLTSFIGREQELAALTELVANYRLVTLTGPGGIGKTRLALHAAAAQLERSPNGVFFVDLAPLGDPTLVPSAVAQALGVQGVPEAPLREVVLRFLRGKRLLLVLDNYEHLLGAAEFVGALLQTGPSLTLAVTSRAPLRVPGEREYAVPPFPLPLDAAAPFIALARNPGVALFAARAQAVRADFALTPANATAVAAICTRLEGLPLAIELAAARVRVLPPAHLLARLTPQLPLLTGGARTAPARQQSLRDTIAWSYALLAPAEQALMRRLAVFAGGCTLDLAAAVCDADGDLGLTVLDGVSSLLEHSLLRESGDQAGEPRYRMLETIREFALGELEASGEADEVRRQLAVQMLQVVRQCAVTNNWPQLDADVDNARTVLGWCIARAEVALGVRLLWALHWYLYNRGHVNEQQVWRRRLLALPEAAPPSISRARLLALSPADLFSSTDQDLAVAELEEAIALSRQLGDTHCLAQALERLALLRLNQNNPGAVVPLAEEAVALRLQDGAVEAAVAARSYLITVAVACGDTATAERLVEANRALAGTAGTAVALFSEALLAVARGDDARVRVLLEDYVRRIGVEQGGKGPNRLVGLAYLAWVAFRQGDTGAAVATCVEILAFQHEFGPTRFLPAVLSVLAQAAARCGLLGASARLLAATDVQRRAFAAEMFGLHAGQEVAVDRVRTALDEATFAEAWTAGAALGADADAANEFGLAVATQLQQLLSTDSVAHPLS